MFIKYVLITGYMSILFLVGYYTGVTHNNSYNGNIFNTNSHSATYTTKHSDINYAYCDNMYPYCYGPEFGDPENY